MSFLQRLAADGIAACSEATFPENDFDAPDWKSTEMVQRTHEYLDELPPKSRRLLVLLFVAVELIALLFTLRRFSRLSVERRTEMVRGWRRSRRFLLRALGDSVKATTTMMYMSHPSVTAYIEEYRACDAPVREPPMEVRPGTFDKPEHVG